MKNYQITIKKTKGLVEKIEYIEFKGTLRTAIAKYNEKVEDLRTDRSYHMCIAFLREGKYSERLKHRPLAKTVLHRDYRTLELL